MKKLPIGIQTFREIIEENYAYVDKTKHAYELITTYKYVFLSRPRRFGKSLFVDTLKEIFDGNKELFKGLYIYDKYDFEPYPVIRIDWNGNFKTQKNTEETAKQILFENIKNLQLNIEDASPSILFRKIIQETYYKYGKKVVVLIDEYDKPILDNIDNQQEALQRRDFLRGVYSQLKANDAYIRFVFLTGISKFSKASIFSGLNNITDISLHSRFGNICGYTQQELETVFAEHLEGADLDKVKEWYNGYNFLGDKVYNPFDILQFIDKGFIFDNYWWQSGNPFSLIALLKNKNYYIPQLENLTIDNTLLNTFDVDKLQIESLPFQAGYLTIDKVVQDDFYEGIEYTLKVPNKEVQISLNRLFFEYLTNEPVVADRELLKDLFYGKPDTLEVKLRNLFASIPYNNYVNNNISIYEGYYASVVYTYLASLGITIIAEDVTNRGRMDLTLIVNGKVYIIEFKVGEGNALQQIKEKRYFEKYADKYGELFLVGINFDETEKNISKFEWEKL